MTLSHAIFFWFFFYQKNVKILSKFAYFQSIFMQLNGNKTNFLLFFFQLVILFVCANANSLSKCNYMQMQIMKRHSNCQMQNINIERKFIRRLDSSSVWVAAFSSWLLVHAYRVLWVYSICVHGGCHDEKACHSCHSRLSAEGKPGNRCLG